jgi:hypothetical protein
MRLCIINKDNTLIRPKPGDKFVRSPSAQIIIPGAIENFSDTQIR